MKNITIRDSGNKEVLEAYFLNHEGQPYNLENKTVTFMENKDGDKFVSDPNVQIVNATAGFVRYTLQSQVHSASGIAWFEINDNSGLVDSTGNFNIRVENGLRATADNTTYIAALEKLKQQMEALIRQADGELKAELQKAEQQLNQELQNFRNQYGTLSNDFQNQFKAAQNARQQDYNNQKNSINQDWTNNKNQIWGQWNGDKANIDRQAQDTINAIKDNAKQVLDKDQADWNAKQASWNDTFSRIVKEWQVKTNSLNSTVQDLTTKFGNIINELTDLMTKKLPDMNAKTDAVQKKVDQLRASLGQIDWTTFAKKNDLSPEGSGINLFFGTKEPLYMNGNGENASVFQSYDVYPLAKPSLSDFGLKPGDKITLAYDWSVTDSNNIYTGQFKANEINQPSYGWGGYSNPLHSEGTVSNIDDHVHITSNNRSGHVISTYQLAEVDFKWINPKMRVRLDHVPTTTTVKLENFIVVKGDIVPTDRPNFQEFLTDKEKNNYEFNSQMGWTLVDSNFNNWTKDDPMKQAAKIDYLDYNTVSVFNYTGVAGSETADYQVNGLMPGKNYTLLCNYQNLTDLDYIVGDQYSHELAVYDSSWNKITSIVFGRSKQPDQEFFHHFIPPTSSIYLRFETSKIQDGVTYRFSIGNIRIKQQPVMPNDLSKIKFRKQSLDQNGNKFEDIQTITQQNDGSYLINDYDSDWTAHKVNWLLNNTTSYNIESNTDLNNVKAPGLYHCSGKTNITNVPSGIDSWFDLYVNSDNWNGSQVIFATNANQVYVRTWHNSTMFTNWRRLINDGDYSNLQNLISNQKLKVVRSYDIERNQAGNPTTEAIGGQWVVDQSALGVFADAHRDVRNHTDYRYPTDQAWNTAINLNSDPYLDTGIYKIGNCAIINGPWTDTNQRHWNYLNVIKYDDNTIYQAIFTGNAIFGRTVSKTTNSYPSWTQFATMDQVAQNVSSVSGNLQAFITDQVKINKRVDYNSPTGTITNDTVNFNNYRETGILKVVNCLIQNGPYKSDYRHTVFLKITNLDSQTQYQTVYEGDNLYGRKLYNGSGQWHKYTNTPI